MQLKCRNTLRQRLMLIALLTTASALVLAASALLVSQLLAYRTGAVRDIMIKADIIGAQCTAALVFKVPRDAEETLHSLSVDAQVRYAAVYTADDVLFAEYRQPGSGAAALSGPAPAPGYRFSFDRLDVLQPILLHGERIGSVFILADQRNLHALLLQFSAAAAVILFISLAAAALVVSRLHRSITIPVTTMVRLMERISQDGACTDRAEPSGPEELCLLTRGLNDMLQTLQERDHDLEQQRRDLQGSVAELQRSAVELQEANRKLEALDKMKSDFISIVSHELRTPLTAIKAFVELLIVKQNMPQERKTRLLQTVNEESDRLGRLINDLLDLSKIEAGTMTWRRNDVSIDEIVRSSLEVLLPAGRAKGVNMSAIIEPSLPHVSCDRDRIVQVLTNMLSNAVKFTPAGGQITLRVSQDAGPPQQIIVAITDTGTGIQEEELELIFDKFHRAGDAMTNLVEGSGLGLSIARQIVEHHGGRIWAESRYGKGSTFTFTLPIQPE